MHQHFTSRACRPWGYRGCHDTHPQILVNQLTLSQTGGADYAHYIVPGFSDLPTALTSLCKVQSMTSEANGQNSNEMLLF